MKNVILSGSSGGIGRAVAEKLQSRGFQVLPLGSRMEDFSALEKEMRALGAKYSIDALVTCAGFGIFQPHETISVEKIQHLITVNLTAPIVLARLCLPYLRKTGGRIVNITSVEAVRHSRHSALYTASKSGLRNFSLALFEEVRKSGVGVTSVNPDITDTPFFDSMDFGPAEDKAASLAPEDVAGAVVYALESPGVITELTIRPQKAGIQWKKAALGR